MEVERGREARGGDAAHDGLLRQALPGRAPAGLEVHLCQEEPLTGARDSEDGRRRPEVGLQVPAGEAMNVGRRGGGDDPRDKAVLPFRPRPVGVRLGHLLTDHNREARRCQVGQRSAQVLLGAAGPGDALAAHWVQTRVLYERDGVEAPDLVEVAHAHQYNLCGVSALHLHEKLKDRAFAAR